MLHNLFRRFSIVEALKALKSEAEVHSQKVNESFMKSYSDYVKKNFDDIYCFTSKITPSQTERVEKLCDEIAKLSPVSHRAFMYLLMENEKKNFNYKPLYKESKNVGEFLWSDEIWPSIHPSNLEFQKETGEFGLIGYHGLPLDFIEKLVSGEGVQRIEQVIKESS